MRKLINISSLSILIVIVFSGCQSKSSGEKEINKLLERQAQLRELQDESLDELQQLRDSLEHERTSLIGERDLKDKRIKQLGQNQQILVDRLKQEEKAAVSTERSKLEESISRYEDSIEQLKNELTKLDTDLDSIERNINLYQVEERQADKILESGISEVDQQITRLERQKQQEIEKADLLKRRILIAEKKIEAYALERQMYVDKRGELLRIHAPDDQLEPFRQRISEMDSILGAQQAQKQAIRNEWDQTMQWISEVDSMMNDMQDKIKLEYDRNQIIDGFIASEKRRLSKELANLEKGRKRLISQQEMILKDLAGTEEKIGSLNKRLELIKNKKMSDILEQQAAIEQSEAMLAQEEIKMLEKATGTKGRAMELTSDSSKNDLLALNALDDQLDSLYELVKSEKAAIASARRELSEKRAEEATKRARFGRTLGAMAVVFIIGGITLLTLFYYLGKRARKS